MGPDLTRPAHLLVFVLGFAAASIAVVYGCSYVLTKCVAEAWMPLVDSLGFFGSYGVLYKMFEDGGWKHPIWRKLGVVVVPDLSGSYRGTFKSSYRDEVGENATGAVRVEIEQKFSSVRVWCYFERSKSRSRIASFASESDGRWILSYTYWNDPAIDAPMSMQSHSGAGRFWAGGERGVEGDYFNWARGNRASVGTISAIWSTSERVRQL